MGEGSLCLLVTSVIKPSIKRERLYRATNPRPFPAKPGFNFAGTGTLAAKSSIGGASIYPRSFQCTKVSLSIFWFGFFWHGVRRGGGTCSVCNTARLSQSDTSLLNVSLFLSSFIIFFSANSV